MMNNKTQIKKNKNSYLTIHLLKVLFLFHFFCRSSSFTLAFIIMPFIFHSFLK